MFKIFLILLIPVTIAAILIFLFSARGTASLPGVTKSEDSDSPFTSLSKSTLDLGSTEPLPTPKNGSVDERVATLESSVSILNKKIDVLTESLNKLTPSSQTSATPIPAAATTTSTTTTGAKTVYIPIGYGGSSTASSDFASISAQEVTVDSSQYSGYKSAVLEVNFRIDQGNGTGEARLFNSTDGTAILSSLVSTTSGSYSTKSSNSFSLSSGSKKYTLQLKSSTGYLVDVQLARIRIDF